MADDDRMHALAAVAAHVEKPRAFRCAHPFVQIAGVIRRPDGADVERQLTGDVRAVDQRVDAARVELCNDAFHRHDHRGLAGDVVDQQQARRVCHAAHHAFDHLVG